MRRLSAPRRVRCARAKRAQRTRPEQASGTIRRMDLARNTKYVIRPMQMRTESAQRAAQSVGRAWIEEQAKAEARASHQSAASHASSESVAPARRVPHRYSKPSNRPVGCAAHAAIWAALDQRARFGRGHGMYPVTQCADWQREAERVLHQV